MRRIQKTPAIIMVLLALALIGWLLWQKNRNNEAPAVISQSNGQGQIAATRYCQSCHLLPDPTLLDKKTWRSFLPEMGWYLGIRTPGVTAIEPSEQDFFPAHPALSEKEWEDILAYYTAAAPEALPALPPANLAPVQGFSPLPPPDFLFRPNVMASLVKIDASGKKPRLFVFDAYSSQLFLFDQDGLQDSLHLPGILTDLVADGKQLYALSIGDQLQMGADSYRQGSVLPIVVSTGGRMQLQKPLFTGLARPVKLRKTETNGDGQPDFLVCEFGKLTGALCLLESQPKNYTRRVIRALPGAVNAFFEKNPETGHQDIWALFAQGDESVLRLTLNADGSYQEEKVLRFPPSYGSSSFDMADLNGDGLKDILYTCGDNGDATQILKPYHGVYVYLQDEKGGFRQSYFHPMYGAYKVVAGDFLKKGRVDLAAIAYFTDPSRPQEWFVYLENKGQGQFAASAAPEGFNLEAALTMDAGDFNGDGQPDLLIGNAFLKNDPRQSAPLFGLMESITR